MRQRNLVHSLIHRGCYPIMIFSYSLIGLFAILSFGEGKDQQEASHLRAGDSEHIRVGDTESGNHRRRRSLQELSGDLFLRRSEFCVPLGSNTYETVRVWAPFSFIYRLRGSEEGACGEVCDIVCDHTPCYDDLEVSADGSLCTCIDEKYLCGTSTECLNDQCICIAGYEGNPLISPTNAGCTDIRECLTPNRCGSVGTCSELAGSYSCTCPAGYTWPGVGFPCKDRNECNEGKPCGENAICSNTIGSYTCFCETGYIGTPPNDPCIDILECMENPDVCGPGTCVETVGSYSCTCDSGYTWSGVAGEPCKNENECLTQSPCDATMEDCTDTEGSYACFCKPGFTGTAGSCEDRQECDEDPNICGDPTTATCSNTFGSYDCACNEGFPGGEPPSCRKLLAWENCPSKLDSDCETGLKCEFTSISDNDTYSCCAETQRCNVNDDCCKGAYTKGEECPSGESDDCRGDLKCVPRALNRATVCCERVIAGVCTDINL